MKKHGLLMFLQFLSVFLVSVISFLLRPVPLIFSLLFYAVIPLFSAFLSCRLVLKRINPYLTWILPPLAETAAGFLISMGIAPDPLPIMIAAFVSLIGSAVGDVINKTQKKGKI